jgi:hypothetical protein
MSVRLRPILVVIAAIGAAVTSLSFAGPAAAAPYTRQPTLSVNIQTPAVGATIVVTGTDFVAGTSISVTLHTAVISLGSVTPNASGAFTTSIALPATVSGTHTIVAAGPASNDTASVTITIGGSTAIGGGVGGGGGGLSNTGVAVMSIGTLGVLLLIGGGLLLLTGRRRRVSA